MIDTSYGDPSSDYYHKEPMDGEESFDEDDDAIEINRIQGPYNQQTKYGTQEPYNSSYQQPQPHQPQVMYRHGYPVNPPAARSSPEVDQGAYVQDGRYHLQQEAQQSDSTPSFV